MVRVVGAYVGKSGSRFDLDYYLNVHTRIAHDLLDAYGLQAIRILSEFEPPPDGTAGLIVVSEMVFSSREAFEVGLKTQGETLFQDLKNFTDISPMLQVCRNIQEET